MIVIPAIDIQGGRAVQLQQGKKDSATVYSDHPPDMARRWIECGGRRLHVVDLDGAFEGAPVNRGLVREIVREAGDVPVQVGGGVRNMEVVEAYLEAGVSQVIIGTRAVQDPPFLELAATRFPRRIILGLDARGGRAATEGWDALSEVGAVDFVRSVSALPLFAIVYTDIGRDGMLAGVNVDETVSVIAAAGVPVIASGGVKDLDDIERLGKLGLPSEKLLGVISGSAIYEGTLDLAAAQERLDELTNR
ncbi:MAG: 1-(5-phosphoribosyl)-5-[(5-phosphoribosylamino)methylideneamino]imidazole-4-carboxamide isomerase [Gammaproteobacteria bacterium]|nr:1-(5-phosphoribosyl)-5-[(5-phosphoribosylamino)methylideneamino]imidazole-4-carboxamide isomerase [Gammaproteobacteria bacterium]